MRGGRGKLHIPLRTHTVGVGSWVGWQLWCPRERRVLGKSIREETAGTGWKSSDLSKFLSR